MFPNKISRRPLLAAMFSVPLVAGAGLFAASCNSDDSGDGDTAVISAISILDSAGLHDIDDAISEEQEIPATAKATAQKLQAVMELTEWPSELEDDAEALSAIFAEMVTAVDGESPDLAKAGEAAKKAHDAHHEFSHDVWAYLYEEAGIAGGEGDGH
jgi:hypothetical protein